MTNNEQPESDREGPPLWGLKFNRYLAMALGLLMLVWLATVIGGRFHWIVLLLVPLFWAYFLAAVLLIEWAVLRIRKKGAPALPFVPAHWSGQRKTLIVMIVFVALVTVVREGAFAPDFTLNFNWYTANHRTSTTANSSGSSAHTGAPIRFAGRFVNCQFHCHPNGALCRAFKQNLRCDNHRTKPTSGQPVVNLNISMHHGDDPFCYTPLIKSAMFQYTARVRAWAASPGGDPERLHECLGLGGPADVRAGFVLHLQTPCGENGRGRGGRKDPVDACEKLTRKS